jgi:hypothetical protein
MGSLFCFQTKEGDPNVIVIPGLFGQVGKNCQIPGSFNCRGELFLMPGAVSRYSPGNNFPPVGHKAPKLPVVLIIDVLDFFRTEFTDLFPAVTNFSLFCHTVVLLK